MLPTPGLISAIDKQRWSVPPEVQAALDYEVTVLTRPESDGMSKLERIYRTCAYPEQRRQEIISAVYATFKKQFIGRHIWFFVDCEDYEQTVFFMKVADTQHELAKAPTARKSFNLNLLRDVSDWVAPPKAPENHRPVANGNAAKPTGQPRAEPKKPTPQRPPARKI